MYYNWKDRTNTEELKILSIVVDQIIKIYEIIGNDAYNKSKKSFRFKPKNDYGDDHAKLIMEDYKVAYPIKEKMENLMIDYSNNLKKFEDSKDNSNLTANE